jgi:alpha-N-arabinofuranosidase
MLEACADHMSLISEHVYGARRPWNRKGVSSTVAHAGRLRAAIRRKVEGHRELQGRLPHLGGRRIPIALDDWNYWHHDYAYGELGCVYDLADGLGAAEGLHEYFRQSDLIQMAHYAQTVNVIGAIKTTRTAAEMETTGLVLQLYRAHYGKTPLEIGEDFGNYDVAAALTADGKTLTVGVVNPTKEELELKLALTGAALAGNGTRWHIAGADDRAHNTPGKPRVIDIQTTGNVSADALHVPALSATGFALPLK